MYAILIIGVLIATLYFQSGPAGNTVVPEPQSGLTITMYDKDGYIVEQELPKSSFGAQAFFDPENPIFQTQAIINSPTITNLPASVTSVVLSIGIKNEGNVLANAYIEGVTLNGNVYTASPSIHQVDATETVVFQTAQIDVSSATGDNQIIIDAKLSPVESETGLDAVYNTYNWLFTRYKADGDSCSVASECESDYCVHGFCRATVTFCGDGFVDPGEDCQNCPADVGCAADETCLAGTCTYVACNSNADCPADGLTGATYCGDASANSDGENKDVYQTYRDYTCSNPGTGSSSCTYTDTKVKQTDCGDSTFGAWGSNFCNPEGVGQDVKHSRTKDYKGCSAGACITSTSTQTEVVQDCSASQYCQSGVCKAYSCSTQQVKVLLHTMEMEEFDETDNICDDTNDRISEDVNNDDERVTHGADLTSSALGGRTYANGWRFKYLDYYFYPDEVANYGDSGDDGDWDVYIQGTKTNLNCDLCMDWRQGIDQCQVFTGDSSIWGDSDANDGEYEGWFFITSDQSRCTNSNCLDYDTSIPSHTKTALERTSGGNLLYFNHDMDEDADDYAEGYIDGYGANGPYILLGLEKCTIG
jgi:hypothetical protein